MTKRGPVPEASHELRAGPLTLIFEAGAVREVRLGNVVALRGVYAAVRDQHWGTVAPRYSDFKLERRHLGFSLSLTADYQRKDIDFRATIQVTGNTRGQLVYAFSGHARSNFLRNRIGLCVLHPAGAAGAACEVERVDGVRLDTHFPSEIVATQPLPPFSDLGRLTHQVAPGVRARVTFEGDLFETEDQRNWTDASFKTFCTPLRLPYPVQVRAGDKVDQRVILDLEGELLPSLGHRRKTVTASIPPTDVVLPALGVSTAASPTPAQAELLTALNLSHLRADIRCAEPDARKTLRHAIEQARTLRVPLELALFLSDELEEALTLLEQELSAAAVARFLVFQQGQRVTSPAVFETVRPRLKSLCPSAQIGAGTDSDFFFLNREPPALAPDFTAFALHPQTHAFDDVSLVETLEVQPLAVQQAAILLGAPVAVSPLTFWPTFNPNGAATSPPDPRQRTAFGAAWTLGSLAALIGSAAAQSVTVFETVGERGLMDEQTVFPLYRVLLAFAAFRGGQAAPLTPSDPHKVGGVVLRLGEQVRILVANFTPESVRLNLSGVPPVVQAERLAADSDQPSARGPHSPWLSQMARQRRARSIQKSVRCRSKRKPGKRSSVAEQLIPLLTTCPGVSLGR